MNIRPLTDLRTNMTEVMDEVKVEDVVYLTKNGRGACVLQDYVKYNDLMNEYARQKELIKLLTKIANSEQSGRDKGYTDFEDFVRELGVE